jgi:rod shape determining protein RodA
VKLAPAQTRSPWNRGLPSLMRTFRPPAVREPDWINPAAMILLGATGVCFIRSAQSFYPGGQQWQHQLVWLALGAALYVAIAMLDYHVWMKNAVWIYAGSLLLLLLLWTPLGEVRSGARRWLGVGETYTIQPSEFAKIGVMVMVSYVLARSKLGTIRNSLAVLGQVGAVVLAPIVLIFLQPDLGSSLVLFPTVFALLYMSNLSARFFVTVFGLFLAVVAVVGLDVQRYEFYHYSPTSADTTQSPPANAAALTWFQRLLQPAPRYNAQGQLLKYEAISWLPLKDYQRDRILTFIAPKVIDPHGIGVTYNMNQSLIAVGTGGLAGKGYENGTQARLGYLPPKVATSDFIMAVFLEETGFLGGVAVIGLYAILMGNTLRIAALARDRFGQLLCVGAAVIFMVHVFVNIGMVQDLLPVKGIPLPLMSYGGSFVLSCCILMGLVQSVYRHRREAV